MVAELMNSIPGLKCWRQREMKRNLIVRQVFFQQHQVMRKTCMKGKVYYYKHREFCFFRGKWSRQQVIFKQYFFTLVLSKLWDSVMLLFCAFIFYALFIPPWFNILPTESAFKNSFRRKTVQLYSLFNVFCKLWPSESAFKNSYRRETIQLFSLSKVFCTC